VTTALAGVVHRAHLNGIVVDPVPASNKDRAVPAIGRIALQWNAGAVFLVVGHHGRSGAQKERRKASLTAEALNRLMPRRPSEAETSYFAQRPS
jgi:hypothetical protein